MPTARVYSVLSHLPWNLVMDNQCLPMGILPSWPNLPASSYQRPRPCLPFRSVSSSRFLLPLLLFRKRAPMFSGAHCSVLRWATESRTNTSLRISGDR